MTEAERQTHNESMLARIDEHESTGNVRSKVKQIVAQLSVYMPAIIHRDVFRSEAEQLQKYMRGVSKVKWGYHCFTRDGKMASLAADIVSADYNYFDDKQFILTDSDEIFWLLLGSFALENGLGWGGFFGLEKGEIGELKRLFESNNFEAIERHADLVKRRIKRLGWDVAHVQCKDLTIEQAYISRS
jgi:hypothetical protein